MIKVVPINQRTGKSLPLGFNPGGEEQLLTSTWTKSNGVWQVYSATLNGTATIITCQPNLSIGLTDLIISVEKVAQTIRLFFTDGVDTATIWTFNTKDAAVCVTLPVMGRFEGWKYANIAASTTGATILSFTIGYYVIPKATTVTYYEWLARRTVIA